MKKLTLGEIYLTSEAPVTTQFNTQCQLGDDFEQWDMIIVPQLTSNILLKDKPTVFISGSIRFIAKEAPHDRLKPGTKFQLFKDFNPIGNGVIIASCG